MFYVGCSVSERYVNPLFEVFDGGDFILSSYRDIEEDFTRMRIYFEHADEEGAARKALADAIAVVGVETVLESGEIPDEDWTLAYRRHFRTERVSGRIYTVPEWESEEFFASGKLQNGEIAIVSDPGMAFGTGKHETTKACLQFIDEIAQGVKGDSASGKAETFLDMGCGSGILSIAAAKLGFADVEGFDVDQEAVDASIENAERNAVKVSYRKFALGRAGSQQSSIRNSQFSILNSKFDVVAANILGPLLIRFADEICGYCKDRLIISGILSSLYPEVLAAYESRGFREISRKTIGEWTTGLLRVNR